MLRTVLLASALVAPIASLAAQQVKVKVGEADSVRTEVPRDSLTGRRRQPVRRTPVTPELEASAFRDPGAKTLLLKARDARMRQDSALLSYDASSYQRISAGLGFRATGRNRLLFRTENASRVRWSRANGVHLELKGARTAIPMIQDIEDADIDDVGDEMAPIPYYPGREQLWVGSGVAKAEVDERELIHPIAIGAEAYYRYSSGDSISFRLSDGKMIVLKELRIEPRKPEWRLSVGSFWFDDSSGQLVRAAYRFSATMDIWKVAAEEGDTEDVPKVAKAMLSPMEANLESVTIEYGLYGGRFWLPRLQSARGSARAGFMRVPFGIDESFKYASVNGTDSLPPIPKAPQSLRDSLFGGDTTRWRDLTPEERKRRSEAYEKAAKERRAQRDSLREAQCASTGTWVRNDSRYDGSVRVAVTLPCDTTLLSRSSELPPSIYDPGEEIFGSADRDELLKSLDFGLQSSWAPQAPTWRYGLNLQRFNRVEGLSLAVGLDADLGRGYSASFIPRLGTADLEPNFELALARTNGRRTMQLSGYRRLSVTNDWGAPLSFGASVNALLFGRDEGFYYRSRGAELTSANTAGGGLTWRLFAERQDEAKRETNGSLAYALNDVPFIENIAADEGFFGGASARHTHTFGYDPQGWRLLSDVRAEAAGGELDYVRGATDLTLSRGFGQRAAAALTGSIGWSGGQVPVQRLWYLGDQWTVRGQKADPVAEGQVGEAFWLGRFEFGYGFNVARPTIFGDLGWAGSRDDFANPGRPMSGAGVGVSVMDGLIRLDYSRGIYPRKRNRLDLYLEARF